jgi:hypothetical protein
MPRPELISERDLATAINHLSARLGRVPNNRELTAYFEKRLKRQLAPNYINRKKIQYGWTNKYLDHSDFIVWTLLPENRGDTEAQYLRILGAVAKEEMRPIELVNKAARLFTPHVKQGEDIRYEPLNPEGERWVYFPADPDNWHLKKCLKLAKAGLKRLTAP